MKMDISDSDLLEELRKEFEASRPPKNAVTVRGLADSSDDISMTYARTLLNKKVKKEGWTSTYFKKIRYYWKPAS